MKFKKIIFAVLFIPAFLSCNKKFDNLLNDPNGVPPSAANADLLLNNVQLSFASFFDQASDFGMQLTRMIHFYGPKYDNGWTPQDYDGIWSTAYTSVIKNADAVIPIADAQKKYVHEGMAKIMKAYTVMTLVDMFGNVPMSEANLGIDNTNPKDDGGASVYAAAIALLDGAISDLSKTPASYPGSQDLLYGASSSSGKAKWITLAKTLKLRAYLQTRLVDNTAASKITTLLTENDLINSQANDFEFKYSTKQANPNSRHPRYNGNYTTTGSAGDYMAHYYMWCLTQEKGSFNNNVATDNSDPRTRYYFYRQRTNNGELTQVTSSCSGSAPPAWYPSGMTWCNLPAGFWGRDHGNGTGIPPDGPLRTTVGIYPFGGDFDANQGTSVSLNRGGQGAGIQPIWLSVFTDFLRAEAALTLGTTGDPRALLQSGIRKSFTKVFGFPATITVTVSSTYVPSQTRQDNYVNNVVSLYDNASTTAGKLDVIAKECYIALWGNGVDAYNMYRRTGKPGNMQYMVQVQDPGPFIRSHYYPAVHVERNQNATQKSSVAVQVFWDNNPAGFIK